MYSSASQYNQPLSLEQMFNGYVPICNIRYNLFGVIPGPTPKYRIELSVNNRNYIIDLDLKTLIHSSLAGITYDELISTNPNDRHTVLLSPTLYLQVTPTNVYIFKHAQYIEMPRCDRSLQLVNDIIDIARRFIAASGMVELPYLTLLDV